MAESQEFFDYDQDVLDALTTGFSAVRLRDYLAECWDDEEQAIRLYLWNARLSKAFLFPLQICEIFLRNAMDAAFSARWGRGWVMVPPFSLNTFSTDSHQRTLARLQRNAANNGLPAPSEDDVVAALTFDFWSNLYRIDYDQALWNDPALLPAIFPNLPPGADRRHVQLLMASINTLRNRIAHHEPIHNRQDHGARLSEILTLIGYLAPVAREWTRQHCTVMTVVKSPPSAHSQIPGRPLAQSNLRPPRVFASDARLLDALSAIADSRPPVVLIAPAEGQVGYTAVTAQAVAAYSARTAADTSGLIDFGEHSLADIAAHSPLAIDVIDHRATTGDAMARFYPGKGRARVDLLVITKGDAVAGLLQRPDARF